MLKIKLARFGKRNQPHYRIVVTEAKSKRDGHYTDNLGFYAPTQTPKVLQVNVESYAQWVKKGAQPTDTVHSLVERYKSGNPFPTKAKQLSKKAKAKQTAAAQAPEETTPVTDITPEATLETTTEVTPEAPAETSNAKGASAEPTSKTPETTTESK